MRPQPAIALVTGASSGIGEASALALAGDGWDLAIGARRVDRVRALAERIRSETGVRVLAAPLDVTSSDSVASFVESAIHELGAVHALVNNAGKALGMDPVASMAPDLLSEMYRTNVEGAVRMTQACLPSMRASGWGHIVMIDSIAGHQVYEGGGGYCASKHALRAVTHALRLELCGEPIRVTSLQPGMVRTEFSNVRLGDAARAEAVYRGVEALSAGDVAECVRWVVSLPDHVDVDEMVLRPRDQAAPHKVYRRT